MRLTPERAVLLLIAAATALRLLLAAITDLGLDEAYAVVVGRQLQLSYFDHPPLAFWIAGTIEALARAAPLLIRLPFILLAAGTTWLLHRLAARHFGAASGFWTAFLFTLAPFFFLSAGSWVVPDGPLCFFLAAAALALSHIVGHAPAPTTAPHLPLHVAGRAVAVPSSERHWRDWLLAGAALGLALLAKYHAVLFALGAVIYFAARADLRGWLRRPQPYVALLLALAIFSPVLVWNAANNWVSFAFQLGRRVAPDPAFMLRQSAFELVYLLPTTALLLIAAIAWSFRASARRATWFFLALGLPTILVMDGSRLFGSTGFPHWAMPGWMFVIPVAAAMVGGWRWPPARPVLATLSLAQFGAAILAVVLLLSAFRHDVDGLDDFRLEATAWSALPQAVANAGPAGFVVAPNWRDGTRIAEALPAAAVAIFDADPRGFAWLPGIPLGADALIIARSTDMPVLVESARAHFTSIESVGTYRAQPDNSVTLDIARATGLVAPYPRPYGPQR